MAPVKETDDGGAEVTLEEGKKAADGAAETEEQKKAREEAEAAAAASEQNGEDQGPTTDETIAQLQGQLENERNGRIAAEGRAATAENRAAEATNTTQDANLALINTTIERIKGENAQMKANYAAALATQDYEKVAELNEAMAINASRLTTLENGKIALEAQPKAKPQPVINDPVEAFAAKLTPKSAQWVRDHPEYVRDRQLNRKMIAAHDLATAELGDEAVDTPAYFAHLENTLKITPKVAERRNEGGGNDGGASGGRAEDAGAGGEGAMSAAAGVKKARTSPAAAPVTRGGGGNGTATTIRLTAAQREAAAASGQTEEEYAANLVALRKEGRVH